MTSRSIALDARQARGTFDERMPKVVVIDLLISGGAGFRLCREFSESGDALVLAGYTLDSADEALDAGVSAFLRKPLEPLGLRRARRPASSRSTRWSPIGRVAAGGEAGKVNWRRRWQSTGGQQSCFHRLPRHCAWIGPTRLV